MRAVCVTAVVFICFFSLASWADVVQLANGDRITGTVTGFNTGQVQIKTEYAGVVTIKLAAVKHISAEKPLHVKTDKMSYVATAVEVFPKEMQVETANDTPVALPLKSVREVLPDQQFLEQQRLAHPGILQMWNGSVNTGFSAARGNAGATTLDVGLDATRVTAKDKFEASFNSLFAQNTNAKTGVTSANNIQSGMSYSINVSPRLFTFGFTNFQSNALQKLDLRNVVGGGAGINVVRSRNVALDVFTGGSLDQEFYSAQPGRRSGEALFGQELDHAPNSRTVMSERLTMFPNLSRPGEYRIGVQSSTTVKLNNWLGWQVTFNDTYVSDPPVGSVNNDLLVSTGLRFSMGSVRIFQPRSKVAEILR